MIPRPLALRSAVVLAITAGCVLSFATGSGSAVRTVLTLGFLLFAPGWALAEALQISDPALRVSIATAASLGVEALVAVTLVWTRAFSIPAAIAILVALTIGVLAVAAVRARRLAAAAGDPS